MTTIAELAATLRPLQGLRTITGAEYTPQARYRSPRGPARPQRAREDVGYSLGTHDLDGRALLSPQSLGVELIYRLKDERPAAEIAFWGRVLAMLAPDRPWAAVTHAPSSGKRPPDQHLATLLCGAVAGALSVPAVDALSNPRPRGNRGSRAAKLLERTENPFTWNGPIGDVLIVDDVIFTRSTAMRCADAATGAGARPYLLILYRA